MYVDTWIILTVYHLTWQRKNEIEIITDCYNNKHVENSFLLYGSTTKHCETRISSFSRISGDFGLNNVKHSRHLN